jgi:rubrerythrin
MRFEQTRDILDHVGAFHHQAGKLFRQLMEHSSNARVRMLLDYMSRHEFNLEKYITVYRSKSTESILESWFKYTHDDDIFIPLRSVDPTADLPFDDVLDLAVDLDAKLLELYEEMVERSTSDGVRDLFSSLLQRELKEKQVLIRSAMGLLDI